MNDLPVNFYIGNHGAAHISDFVNLARYELLELGVPMIVTSQIFADRPNIILENFADSRLINLVNSNFNERDERLIMIATEILRDGIFNSASPKNTDKQSGQYTANSRHWILRTKGFQEIQKAFGAILCPAEPIVKSLSTLVPAGNLFYWPLRYLNLDPQRNLSPSMQIKTSALYDLVFTGTLTPYRSEMIQALADHGIKVQQASASTPDYLRYALASQSRFQFAPKHYPETPQVSKMRLHWGLNNAYPILVERCSEPSDLDPFVMRYETVDGLLDLLNDPQILERSHELSLKYQHWSASQKSVFCNLEWFTGCSQNVSAQSQQAASAIVEFKRGLPPVVDPSVMPPRVFAQNLEKAIESSRKKLPVVGIYIHGRSYRSEILSLYNKLKVSKTVQLALFIGESVGDKLEDLPEALVVTPCDQYVCELNCIDLIITTTPITVEQLPKNALKAYLTHDINDSPLGDLNYQASLLRYYDFIYVAGPVSGDQFRELIAEKIKEPISISGATKVIEVGYPKLDRLICQTSSISRDKVIICPTHLLPEWGAYTLTPGSLLEILDVLSKSITDHLQTVVFRPHPHSLNSPCRLLFERLAREDHYPGLALEVNEDIDYAELYGSSDFMITDFSGTGSTYMTAFLRPTFYYVPNGFPPGTGRVTDCFFRSKGLVVGDAKQLRDAVEKSVLADTESNRVKYEEIRHKIVANVGRSLEALSGHIAGVLIGCPENDGRQPQLGSTESG